MYYVSKAPFQIYACRRKKAVLSWNFFSVQEFDRYTQRPSAQRCVWSLGKAITIGNLPSWSASAASLPQSHFPLLNLWAGLIFFLEWVQSQSWSQTWPVWFLHLELASELLLIFRPTITQSPNHPIIKISKGSVGTPREWEKCVSRKMITTRLSVCNVLSSPVNLNI